MHERASLVVLFKIIRFGVTIYKCHIWRNALERWILSMKFGGCADFKKIHISTGGTTVKQLQSVTKICNQ